MIRRIFGGYRQAFSGLPRDVWLLCGVALVNRMGTMVLPFVGLYLTQQRGLSAFEAGRVIALWGVGSIAGSLAGGWLCDRIGATRTQLLSLGLGGAGLLLLGQARTAGTIAAVTLVASLLSEALRPALMSDLAHRAPPELRVRAYGLLRLAVNAGMGIGPAVGGWLALRGYGWLFLVDALTCWLAAWMLWWSLGGRSVTASGDAEEDVITTARSPWRDRPFLVLLGLVVVLASILFQFLGTLPMYYRDVYDMREGAIGLLLGFNAALVVAFEMLLLRSVQHRERMGVVGAGCAMLCLGFGAMPFGSSLPFVAATVVAWTFGEMLTLPLLNAVVADRAGSAMRGRYMGAYMVAFSMAFVLAPLLGTYVYERVGRDALWYGILALAFPCWWVARRLSAAFPGRPTRPA